MELLLIFLYSVYILYFSTFPRAKRYTVQMTGTIYEYDRIYL